MKKVFPLFFAATIASSSFAVYAQAGETKQVVGAGQTEGEMTKEKNSLEEVKELTLEDVIRRGTENSKNLTVLQLNLEIIKNQILKANYDKDKAAQEIKKLENKIEDLKDEKERLSVASKRSINIEDRTKYRESIEALEDQIKSLDTLIKKLEAGQLQLQFQEEEVKEGVRLMLTSSYTNILLLQEQMGVTKKSLQSAINAVNKAQRLYDLGRVSKEAVRQAQLARENVEKQLKDQEKSYGHTVADLSYEIGVAYNPNVIMKPIEFKATDFAQPTDISFLIEHSFKMKKAQKDLESAILERDNVYKDYENGDAKVTIYDKAQQDYQVKIAEESFASTKDHIATAIKQLYQAGEDSYSSYEEAVRQLENKRKDLNGLTIRYKLGRVSKYDYEQAQLGLEQAELKVFTAKVQNYTIQQSIAALQRGYVQ
ncbi:TolC family protein [Bacillus songklensis]|uniref:TolC family protein n=1 Tax=Bacillus songklensis TaxID=1069116 RepID=A0ABV8B3G3_9BACI